MVVVVVPLLVVVVVVELFVVLTGQETLCAWMTTPGPKLQLLVDDGVDVEVFDVGATCAPLAPLSMIGASGTSVVVGTSLTTFVFTIVVIGASGLSAVVASTGTGCAGLVGCVELPVDDGWFVGAGAGAAGGCAGAVRRTA